MAKRLLCYLGVHRYQRRQNDRGEWYKKCRACGKFKAIRTHVSGFIGGAG